jgi:hypothetical protein
MNLFHFFFFFMIKIILKLLFMVHNLLPTCNFEVNFQHAYPQNIYWIDFVWLFFTVIAVSNKIPTIYFHLPSVSIVTPAGRPGHTSVGVRWELRSIAEPDALTSAMNYSFITQYNTLKQNKVKLLAISQLYILVEFS